MTYVIINVSQNYFLLNFVTHHYIGLTTKEKYKVIMVIMYNSVYLLRLLSSIGFGLC